MARQTGPKNKLARRIGEDLGLKTNALKLSRRLNVPPGQHGLKGKRKQSNYGIQLREKQKAKYIFGILEKQLRRLYDEASNNPTATGSALLSLLERRLDNVIYRAGLAPTRAAARQLVAHGHVEVNNKKMTAPSYRVNVGDLITIKKKSRSIPFIADAIKETPVTAPWMEYKAGYVSISRFPDREDTTEMIDEQLIVEYYSL